MKPGFLMALVLTACTMQTLPSPTLPPSPTACPAPQLHGLVGLPATILQAMRFGSVVRIIRPGMGVTMDYSANRLNFIIDTNEKISRVYCG